MRTDFKLKLCSSYVCIQSPASSTQVSQTHWHDPEPPWAIPGLCMALSRGSRPHPDLPRHCSASRCASPSPIPRRRSRGLPLPPDLWSVSSLASRQEDIEMLTSLPGKLLLKTKQSQGTCIIGLGMWHSSWSLVTWLRADGRSLFLQSDLI